MADSNSTDVPTPEQLSDELNTIAGRLAGLESVLRRVAEDGGVELSNTLNLMAEVALDANRKLCLSADRIYSLNKVMKAGFALEAV